MTQQERWFKASQEADCNTLKQLLDNGFDIDAVDNKQNTALHLASKHAHLETITLLIQHGAKLNLQNDWLSTPLHVTKKNIDAIRLLLEAGADPNIQDKDWDYPYYFAFYGSMTKELTLLYIKHGANLTFTAK